jgi:hypothetical protein
MVTVDGVTGTVEKIGVRATRIHTAARTLVETVTYVSNIYKYYITYRLITDQRERREAAKAQIGTGKPTRPTFASTFP